METGYQDYKFKKIILLVHEIRSLGTVVVKRTQKLKVKRSTVVVMTKNSGFSSLQFL